jgi:TRAP-type C4-dicarboxylate transport system permease small subunit
MKKVVLVISDLMILFTLLLLLNGSWKMTMLNIDSTAPATSLPMSYVYGTGIVLSIFMLIIVINNLYRVLFNKINDGELVIISESEELIILHEDLVEKDSLLRMEEKQG